jgi:threonyl-tRNA synthetase
MPIVITLPDGTQKTFLQPITVAEIAATIGSGLAKAALAGKVDQQLVDTSYLIEKDAHVQIITEKSPEALEIIRHSTAHLLAQAVKQLFPSAQVTIGPVIEDGFYYDFSFPQGFTPEDLQHIEAKMHELAAKNWVVTRRVIGRKEAIDFFRERGEKYKAKIIEDIPEQETLTVYQQGDFVDLCRGPHVPNTDKLKVFKLMKVAGAYWRGDSRNEMLQRIYGTAWTTRQELETYLHRLEEAEKRDHRKLAKVLDLYHIQEEAPGMVFWHDNGLIIYQTIEHYIRNLLREHGYQEVKTPLILDLSLWEKSGHKDKFFKEMFATESENRQFAIKPMNCPGHVQIFNQGLRSYRELPLRLAEFGSCHRNEPSGALHGLFRVRQFVQDDAHIFCTEDQIQEEVSRFIDLLFQVYKDFGFDDVIIKLSTRPPQRVGSDEIWDKAEKALADALNAKKLDWQEQAGDGAFYGPKIEFVLRDCLGRLWTTGSVQLDFSMPERLGAEYVTESGNRKVPVMLHRAICGSLERFIGILLEHYAGQLPLWLAPTQVVIMNITDRQADYANQMAQLLKNLRVRVKLDLRNEKIGFKIREHTLQKVPYQVVVGDREVEQQTVAIRTLAGQDKGSMPLATFADLLKAEIAQHSRGDKLV